MLHRPLDLSCPRIFHSFNPAVHGPRWGIYVNLLQCAPGAVDALNQAWFFRQQISQVSWM